VIFVGIDPGKRGAVAMMMADGSRVQVYDCPLTDDGEYDYQGMRDMLTANFQYGGSGLTVPLAVVIEKVHAMPHDGRASAFSFGVGYGAWLALVGGVLRIKPTLVPPQRWKRSMLAGIANAPQAEAEALRRRMGDRLPAGMLEGPRGGLRDGRVDALWLAEYGRCMHRFVPQKSEV
jgi:hypothetical protein